MNFGLILNHLLFKSNSKTNKEEEKKEKTFNLRAFYLGITIRISKIKDFADVLLPIWAQTSTSPTGSEHPLRVTQVGVKHQNPNIIVHFIITIYNK